jgi:hypothetical protein
METERFFVVSGTDTFFDPFYQFVNKEKSVIVRANSIAEAIDAASTKVRLDFYVAVEATKEDLLNTDFELINTL